MNSLEFPNNTMQKALGNINKKIYAVHILTWSMIIWHFQLWKRSGAWFFKGVPQGSPTRRSQSMEHDMSPSPGPKYPGGHPGGHPGSSPQSDTRSVRSNRSARSNRSYDTWNQAGGGRPRRKLKFFNILMLDMFSKNLAEIKMVLVLRSNSNG